MVPRELKLSHLARLAALTFSILLMAQQGEAKVQASFAYGLSDFYGPVPSLWARVDADPGADEVYTLNINEGLMRIYNGAGMQVHAYGEGYGLASASDLAIGEEGDVFILFGRQPGRELLQLDYRGDAVAEFGLTGIPEGFLPFQPTFIDYRDGSLYLADGGAMRVLEFSPGGEYRRGWDFKAALSESTKAELDNPELSRGKRELVRKKLEAMANASFGGFSVDASGRFYFTVPTLFTACRAAGTEEIESFGVSGGAPGKFGVTAGIEADEHGNIYVADRLRSVVLIFDPDFNFQTEFGYRGPARHNLVVPNDLAVDAGNGKVFVSQAANRGVSVFHLRLE